MTPDAGVPGPPAQASPAQAAAGVPAQAALALLSRFSRAVQRSTIYPDGHPSVRQATSPLVETLTDLLRVAPSVVVGATRERAFVGTSQDDSAPYDTPWLSGRLSGRGIAMIVFRHGVTAETVEQVVAWLARGPELTADVHAPEFEAAAIVPVDFAGVRFREGVALTEDQSPTATVWRAMTRHLGGEWLPASGTVPVDPAELAHLVLGVIERQEGTGVRQLTDRVVSLHGELVGLPPDVRAAVKLRLARFIAALSPELRGQLLSAAPADQPEKLDLLSEIVDQLPQPLVIELIRNLDFKRGSSTAQFITFVMKLASVAAAEPRPAEAFEARTAGEGLPRDLLYFDQEKVGEALRHLFERGGTTLPNPAEYQEQLESLAATTVAPRRAVDFARLVHPGEVEQMAAQVGRIALQLLATAEGDADRVACIRRLQTQLPAFLRSSSFDLLARSADALRRAAGSSDATVARQADAALRFFLDADAVTAVLGAVRQATGELPAALVTLARAGGHALAQSVLAILAPRPDQATRERLTSLLVLLEPEAVRQGLVAAYKQDPAGARAMLSALAATKDGALLAETLPVFVADRDVSVRAEAYRLLLASRLTGPRLESTVNRAFGDDDPRVVDVVLEATARQVPLVSAKAVGGFLASADAERFELQQCKAVGVLARARSSEARGLLVHVLAGRHGRMDAPSRRVSRCIADALLAGGANEVAAAKSWRRSPAGLLSRVMGDVPGRLQ